MTCHALLSHVQMKLKGKAATRGRPMAYSYLLFLLMAITILTVSASCTLPVGVPQAPPEQPGTSEPNPAAPQQPSTPEPAPVSPAEQVPYVTVEELLQKMDSRADVLVIDARLKEYYDEEHIKGAISMPLSTIVAREFVLPPTKEIVLYCGCPDEETSTQAALELIKQGFLGVKVLKGGYNAWKEKGYPTQTGG